MALIKSSHIALGSALDHFSLEDPEGNVLHSKTLFGKGGFIIAVMCNHCPYSNAIWKRLITVADFAKKLDITTVAINPNIHPNYPEDSPSHMVDKIEEMGIDFPYLITPIHQKLTIKKRTLFALILKKRSGKIWQQKQEKN
jgi:hypothetical protein